LSIDVVIAFIIRFAKRSKHRLMFLEFFNGFAPSSGSFAFGLKFKK
jgi:hypothetical protein